MKRLSLGMSWADLQQRHFRRATSLDSPNPTRGAQEATQEAARIYRFGGAQPGMPNNFELTILCAPCNASGVRRSKTRVETIKVFHWYHLLKGSWSDACPVFETKTISGRNRGMDPLRSQYVHKS